jgi:hypothetical protein
LQIQRVLHLSSSFQFPAVAHCSSSIRAVFVSVVVIVVVVFNVVLLFELF